MYTCANGSAWRGANRRYISWWAASLQAISRNQPSTTDRPTANDQITYTCTHRRGEVPTAVIITHGGPAQSGQTSPVHKNTKAMQQAATSQAHNRPTGANLQAISRIQPSTTDRPTDRSPAQKGKAFKQSVATNAQLTDQPKPSG